MRYIAVVPLCLALIALTMAAACAPAVPAPAPDEYEASHHNAVYWHGTRPLTNTLAALHLIEKHGLAECQRAGRGRAFVWCAEVHWFANNFACGPIQAEGCQPNPPECAVQVVWHERLSDTALVDELGHYVWEKCHGRSGEYVPAGQPNTTREYEPDFSAWIHAVNEEIATTLEP